MINQSNVQIELNDPSIVITKRDKIIASIFIFSMIFLPPIAMIKAILNK